VNALSLVIRRHCYNRIRQLARGERAQGEIMRQRLLSTSVLGLALSCSSGSGGGAASGGSGATSGSSGASSAGSGAASGGFVPTPDAGDTASREGGTSDAATLPPTCGAPAHVLPMDPNDAQSGITLSGFYVDTDTWNVSGYAVSQTMYVCDYDNWYVVATMNDDAHDGAVKTYPNVHKDFSSAPRIDSFTAISSTFSHAGPHVGIYEFAYDIWLNGVAGPGSTEVMIWTDNYHQVPSGAVVETVTFDGQSYQVYKSGSYIAFVETTNVTSGTLDLAAFFTHIAAKGWIPTGSTLGAIDYGVELVSTGGSAATFAVSAFTLTAN
jgi:hypothetical protein